MLTWLAHGRSSPGGGHEAGWLTHLEESALGLTRLGEQARRSPRYRRHLDGDADLATQIETFPDEDETNLAKARHQRSRASLQHALGAARINLTASELLTETGAILKLWVEDVCNTRGTQIPFKTDS